MITSIVFDLGDVLFTWSSHTETSISSKILREMLSVPTWFDYECGRCGEDECYDRLAAEFSLDPREVATALRCARESLRPNDQLVSLIHELKAQSHGSLRVYAMSNISAPDYEFLRTTKHVEWTLFDRVFTSAAARERKPNLAFYTHVISETGLDPRRSVFVDDKIENVLSARSLGFHGIIFDSADNVARQLRNLCGDPIKRGMDFLRKNAGNLHSVTDSGVVIYENFAQLLTFEATGDRSLVSLTDPPRTWNFFHGKGVLTKEEFPDDLDTTSLGLTMLPREPDVIHSVLDQMLKNVNADGIVQTYFDDTRPRIDACVCVNVCTLFYRNGRDAEIQRTLEWVYQVLVNRAYVDGTRYYSTAECFLFFIGRFLTMCPNPEIHRRFASIFKERVQERIGVPGDALALGMRLVACSVAGISNPVDMRTLLSLQCDDGGWEIGWVYRLVAAKVMIGSRGMTTAIALQAISNFVSTPPPPAAPLTSMSRAQVESKSGVARVTLSDEGESRPPSFLQSLRQLVLPTY
ncbi:HAD-like protein [Laetiporus sulphureus 93-53]|uniref:HAD-like protein n=1 Tax=Laetiporus sulphureus 93-53 TaxID=1314785 RepID=A0A165DHG8_9APHY|nr:HAD-like protein [Laetiporus sulphureus 93-53]KZT04889.1 HAD-like protein [Laetiporus sulphureus 93-53]